jgi:large conductance mechanosensitive channel
LTGFRRFVLRGNVIELAVAVVVGVAFANVVAAVVKGIITPFIGIFGGVPDFASLSFTVNNSRFMIGDFINVVLTFLITAAVIYYFVVVPYTRLIERLEQPSAPATRECPECLSKVPAGARRCAFCSVPLPS